MFELKPPRLPVGGSECTVIPLGRSSSLGSRHICGLYPCSTFHHQGPIVSLYTPCEYSGSPGKCCADLSKFVYLQIVPLLLRLYQSPMEVFHYNWSCVMLVMQVCCGHYPGLIVVGSRLVLCPANLLLQLVVVKQGLRFS